MDRPRPPKKIKIKEKNLQLIYNIEKYLNDQEKGCISNSDKLGAIITTGFPPMDPRLNTVCLVCMLQLFILIQFSPI